LRVVGMEMAHMVLGNDMVLGLEDGNLALGDMGQGKDDMGQGMDDMGQGKDDMEQHDAGGVQVGGMALDHDIGFHEVDGILAFLEEGPAWRNQDHCGIQQHQSDHMFLCIH